MRSCVVIFVIISFLFIVPLLVSAAGSNEVVDDKDAKPEHTIILECQHSDYRTYIKCLKRQKRHHEHHDSGGSRSCLDECGLDLCTSTQCVHQCHTKCMKKTKETRQFITQYETVCNDNDCTSSSSGSNAAPPNITTNIDINNVIHNHVNTTLPQQPCLPPTGPGGTPGGGGGDGNQTPRPVPPGCPGYPGTPGTPGMPGGPGTSGTPGTPGFGCNPGTGYGCNTQPIQVVAQVSFGIGLSQLGGCINSYSWPCIQQAQPTTFDCSMCTNPWYKYRCDVQCYNMVQPQVAATPNQILRN